MKFGLKSGIRKSNTLYNKAKKYIASGTNTFSRAPGVFPDGAAPKFLHKQKGCHVWDVDGNKYIDMVMGCGPVTLGHNNAKINNSIKILNPRKSLEKNLDIILKQKEITSKTKSLLIIKLN